METKLNTSELSNIISHFEIAMKLDAPIYQKVNEQLLEKLEQMRAEAFVAKMNKINH